jgi:hypothetical protein
MFGTLSGVAEQVGRVGRLEAQICEGAARLAGLTLGKDVLRHQKRSAERSDDEADPNPGADDCSPEPLRPKVSNADAPALMVETMLAADHGRGVRPRLPRCHRHRR